MSTIKQEFQDASALEWQGHRGVYSPDLHLVALSAAFRLSPDPNGLNQTDSVRIFFGGREHDCRIGEVESLLAACDHAVARRERIRHKAQSGSVE